MKQEAFEKCWAHSPLRAAARHLFYIAIHQVSLLSHAACASMFATTSTTTTTRDREDRYGPMEWAKLMGFQMILYSWLFFSVVITLISSNMPWLLLFLLSVIFLHAVLCWWAYEISYIELMSWASSSVRTCQRCSNAVISLWFVDVILLPSHSLMRPSLTYCHTLTTTTHTYVASFAPSYT